VHWGIETRKALHWGIETRQGLHWGIETRKSMFWGIKTRQGLHWDAQAGGGSSSRRRRRRRSSACCPGRAHARMKFAYTQQDVHLVHADDKFTCSHASELPHTHSR